MINIHVQFFNILAAYTGKKTVEISVQEGIQLSDAIVWMAGQFSPAFQEIVIPQGVPSQHLRIFLNEKPVSEKEYSTPLQDGDEIMLFPAVAGGCRIVR